MESLLKLHPKTPEPFVFLISGSLPARATLHKTQLSLFSMICRLPNNILNSIARHFLLSPGSGSTWFAQVESICWQYALPHPLYLLDNPPKKDEFKHLVKLQVEDYWLRHYRSQLKDNQLPSLRFFKSGFCNLSKPHPILTTAKGSYEVNEMIVQLRLLSGHARLGTLLRHFSLQHDGVCELCHLEVEDLAHFLLPKCPLLQERALLLIDYMQGMLLGSFRCSEIFQRVLQGRWLDPYSWLQFVLDCSVLSQVVRAAQEDHAVLDLLFKATSTYCYSLHRTRLKLLGRWTC